MLAKAYTKLIEGLATLSGLMLAGVCLLIVYDVIARNLGLQPPASTVALTEYALLYFTMAAAPWLVRTRGHIVVEILHSRLDGTPKVIVDRVILAICLLVSLCF
jgi:C4-dicarboxylate transporter DctQ subunit